MKLRWAALSVVLAFSALMPSNAAGQTGGQPSAPRRTGPIGKLGQNYPNPFNPETWIPFSVDSTCTEPNRQYRVTMRIYNLLTQVVAVPRLQGGSGSTAGGDVLENVVVSCGSYTAYWNGKYLNSDREAASGVYLYRLYVDGQFQEMRKFLVTK
jgi:hypothetical protein